MPDQSAQSPGETAAVDAAGDISFDKAEYASTAAPVCASCKRPISGRYYQLNGKAFCGQCHDLVLAHFARKRPFAQKLAGAFLVLAAVVGCSVGWYVIAKVTGYEIGLIAIGVAWVIAKALRRASGGLGSRGLQVAALVLTYFSIAGSNVPVIVDALAQTRSEHAAKQVAVAEGGEAPAKPLPAVGAPAKPPPDAPPLGPVGLVVFGLLAFGLALAAPFLGLPQNALGLLIIGIALYQAWRLTAAIPLRWEGPLDYQAPAAAPAPENASGG